MPGWDAKTLRFILVKWLEENSDLLTDDVGAPGELTVVRDFVRAESGLEMDEYVHEMGKHGVTWGDEITLLAASVLFEAEIGAIEPGPSPDPRPRPHLRPRPRPNPRPSPSPSPSPAPAPTYVRLCAPQGGDRHHLLRLGGPQPHHHAARRMGGAAAQPALPRPLPREPLREHDLRGLSHRLVAQSLSGAGAASCGQLPGVGHANSRE